METMRSVPDTANGLALDLHQFVRSLTHDIANPLNAIAMNAELAKALLDRGDTRTARTVLESLLADCLRCGQLVQSIQDFGTALQPAPREPIEARALLQGAIERMRGEMCSGTNTAFQIEGAADACVVVDSAALERAFAAVLQNAVEAGASLVKIRLAADGGWLRTEVIDNGAGIKAELRARATDPFFTTRRAQGASGLGLTLARALVVQHGGTLDIATNNGGGTLVRMTLPTSMT
jgi:signal transduction histidine kinase